MRAAFLLLGALALVATVSAKDWSNPVNGLDLENTLRAELDDIWVVQWYQDKAGEGDAEPSDSDKKFNEANGDVQMLIQKQCPTLNKEYKFVKADMDPEK